MYRGVGQIAPLDAQVLIIDTLNDLADGISTKVVVFNRIPDLEGRISLVVHGSPRMEMTCKHYVTPQFPDPVAAVTIATGVGRKLAQSSQRGRVLRRWAPEAVRPLTAVPGR